MFNIPFVNDALGWVLRFIADLTGGSFAISIFVFTILINLALIPLSVKSQKSSVQQLRIKPKLDELKKQYGDDRQKMAMAQQQLYQEEGVSMSGGCLPMILRLVLMMCIYGVILSPFVYLMNVDKAAVNTVITSNAVVEILDSKRPTELEIIRAVKNGDLSADKIPDGETEKEQKEAIKVKEAITELAEKRQDSNLKFHFMGIDLTEKPVFNINIFNSFKLNWLMPIIAFLAQIISSLISMAIQKKTNPDAPNMAGMLFTMPLISLFIGFGFPCGVTFYWACSSLIGGVIQAAIQYYNGPHRMLARERVKELSRQCNFEEGQIEKTAAKEAE